MGKCLHCKRASYCRRHAKIQLIERDSLHPVMWINPHILTKYRPLDLPWRLCVRSIFQINNETINIWSHLIGFIYIGLMQYWCAFYELPKVNAPKIDYIVMASSMLCSQICMALSSAYHTFGCQNEISRRKWLKADLFGVSLALSGIYMSGIYTSFYRFTEIQRMYSGCFAIIFAIAISVPLLSHQSNDSCGSKKNRHHHHNHHHRYQKATEKINKQELEQHTRRIGITHLVYIGLSLFGLYPSWHWLELHGGFSSPHVLTWLPTLIILFALVGFAFVFYVTLIPERFCPGKFDVIGCSHQWWHILILGALVYWHDAGIKLLTYYHTTAQLAASINNEFTMVNNIGNSTHSNSYAPT